MIMLLVGSNFCFLQELKRADTHTKYESSYYFEMSHIFGGFAVTTEMQEENREHIISYKFIFSMYSFVNKIYQARLYNYDDCFYFFCRV